jgi:hypothetical protein
VFIIYLTKGYQAEMVLLLITVFVGGGDPPLVIITRPKLATIETYQGRDWYFHCQYARERINHPFLLAPGSSETYS